MVINKLSATLFKAMFLCVLGYNWFGPVVEVDKPVIYWVASLALYLAKGISICLLITAGLWPGLAFGLILFG